MAETLDHFARFCDRGILVLDDASEDDTAEIASSHDAVLQVLHNRDWRPHRVDEEWRLRQVLLDRGRLEDPEWFLYFDADERLEVTIDHLPDEADGITMRLFDAYITADDAHLVGTTRSWFGPEYREILMFYKNLPGLSYHLPDQRAVAGVTNAIPGGFVKHYGKAISVEEWERTCTYYTDNFPEPYRTKWARRRGCAVHVESDFGRSLLQWDDVKVNGVAGTPGNSPQALSPAALRALAAASANWYLCPVCGDVTRLVLHNGEWRCACPKRCTQQVETA